MRSACSVKRDLMFALYIQPCAVDRAGVTPLQSGSRFKRGVEGGGGGGGQEWVSKERNAWKERNNWGGGEESKTPQGANAGETGDKCFKPCLSLHDFFFFLSSHVLFLQLCRFTSISLPPVCTSQPSIYICLCLLWMLLSPSTHSAHTHTHFLVSHAQPFYLYVLNCPSPAWLVTPPPPSPLSSELYPNPSVHSLSSSACVSHPPVLSFPPVPDWIIIIPQMDFRSDDSAFRTNI